MALSYWKEEPLISMDVLGCVLVHAVTFVYVPWQQQWHKVGSLLLSSLTPCLDSLPCHLQSNSLRVHQFGRGGTALGDYM